MATNPNFHAEEFTKLAKQYAQPLRMGAASLAVQPRGNAISRRIGMGSQDFGPANYGGDVRGQVYNVARQLGIPESEFGALNWLINRESGWNPSAANKRSSARGLFQKMTSIHGPVERDVAGQANWGLNYILGRYGSPSKAAAFHRSRGWY